LTAPRLSRAVLDQLPPHLGRPAYSPERHGVGVVHLGPGAFHRAHQAAIFDEVLAGEGGDWRTTAVALRSDRAVRQLGPQDGLYALQVQDGVSRTARVVGSIAQVLNAATERERALDALASPSVHLVTLTVTEKAYAEPSGPDTAVGLLLDGLERRRASHGAPLTLLACDNLRSVGDRLRARLLEGAAGRSEALARYVEGETTCPNGMVDRITPATAPADLDAFEAEHGLRDEALVRTEPFRQWVLDDRFAGPRPDLAAAGVQLVADVAPYEAAKLRMLNGAHSLLAYLGLLSGHAYVHQAIEDPVIGPRVARYMREEAAPTLPPGSGLDPDRYAADLLRRFRNPGLPHALAQIAQDGSEKLSQRLGPVIEGRLAAGRPCQIALLGLAAWAVWLDRGGDRAVDPRQEALKACVDRTAGRAEALIPALLALDAFDRVPALRRPEVADAVVSEARALQSGAAWPK
jgi:fructuronate reductase